MKSLLLKRAAALGVAAVCAGSMLSAEAIPVTSQAALGGPLTVIDFSQFNSGYTFTNGPTQVGGLVGEDVVYTAIAPGAGFAGGPYVLGGNGNWSETFIPGRDGYAFLNIGGTSMTFKFNSGPVRAVGGFMNYCAECDFANAMIEALGLGGVVLETFNVETDAPIVTPNATNDGAFRGIVRATADIFAFRVSADLAVLDDLSFVRDGAVPEPATTALLGLGLLGAGVARRRARA